MVYEHDLWRDRFQKPTVLQLRDNLPSVSARLFDRARKRVRTVAPHEAVEWYGQCWCWTIEYRMKKSAPPVAVIIPAPTDLQLAMTLDESFLSTLSTKRMKRSVLDGLELARSPFDTNWSIWTLQPGTMIDDLQHLIEQRCAQLVESGVS